MSKKTYKIGADITIQGHINDPEYLLITCRTLSIQGMRVCKKGKFEDWQIIAFAKDVLQAEYDKRNALFLQVLTDVDAELKKEI